MRNRAGYTTTVCLALACACVAAAQSVPRALVDPWTGTRWQLAADPAHPGGPGRLLPSGTAIPRIARPAPSTVLVIRAGDRLTVDDSTSNLRARYAALALAPAARGAVFLARLAVSGRAVRVLALDPGHAVLAPSSFSTPETEAEP